MKSLWNKRTAGTKFVPITDPNSGWNTVLTAEQKAAVLAMLEEVTTKRNDAVLYDAYARALFPYLREELRDDHSRSAPQ